MRNSNLTRHAEARLRERCKLSPEELKQLLDNRAGIPVALQKGGRHAKHLLYSSPDQGWFIVVQDAGDGGVLTVMPLDYVKYRIPVTAAQRRSARSRVRAFENSRVSRTPRYGAASPVAEMPTGNPVAPPQTPQSPAAGGWKIRVCYTMEGETRYSNLPRTLPEHGDPEDWTTPGMIHDWLRERLIEASIPFKSVELIGAERKGLSVSADCLLEHLPLTLKEIQACR